MVNYEKLINRNWLFISNKLQKKIKKTVILSAGTGLGSQICILAARVGFENFIVADGDTVDYSNLNRQHYFLDNLNKNKSKELKKQILRINPKAKIKVLSKFLDTNDLKRIIPKVDIVLNTIDLDAKAFVDCSALCGEYGKLEIFPVNIGFSGTVICFNGAKQSFNTYFKTADNKILKKKILDHIFAQKSVSLKLKKLYQEYLKSKREGDPQNGISTYITAAVSIILVLKYLNNEKLKNFPFVYHIGV